MGISFQDRIKQLSPDELKGFKQSLPERLKSMNDSARNDAITKLRAMPDIFPEYTKQTTQQTSTPTTVTQPTTKPIGIVGKAWNAFNVPFNWIGENVTEPFGAVVTSPFTSETKTPRKPGESWLASEKRQYQEQVPGLAKFGIETIPWLLPSIISGGAGAIARGASAASTLGKVASGVSTGAKALEGIGSVSKGTGFAGAVGKLGTAGKVIGTAAEISPWGIAERATGAVVGSALKLASKPIKRLLSPVATSPSSKWDIPTDDLINQIYTPDGLREFNQWAQNKPIIKNLTRAIWGDSATVNATSKLPLDVAKRALYNSKVLLDREAGIANSAMTRLQIYGDTAKLLNKTIDGELMTAVPKTAGKSRFVGDVLENLDEYKFSTKESQQYFDAAKDILKRKNQALVENGLKPDTKINRPVKGIQLADGTIKESKFGSDPSLERIYETQEEAVKAHLLKGERILYETDPTLIMQYDLDRAFTKIARKRFTDSIKTLGKSAKDKFVEASPTKAQQLENLFERQASAKYAVNALQKMITSKGVSIPGASLRKIRTEFPEMAGEIDNLFTLKPDSVGKVISAIGNELKQTTAEVNKYYSSSIKNVIRQSNAGALQKVSTFTPTEINDVLSKVDNIGQYVVGTPLTSKADEFAGKFRVALENFRKSGRSTTESVSSGVTKTELKKVLLSMGLDETNANGLTNRAYQQVLKSRTTVMKDMMSQLDNAQKILADRLKENQKVSMMDVEKLLQDMKLGEDTINKLTETGYIATQKANKELFNNFATANRDIFNNIKVETNNLIKPLARDRYEFMQRYASRQNLRTGERTWEVLPEFRGKFFPDEVVTFLEKEYKDKADSWLKLTSAVSGVSRTATATLDDSAPFTFGLFTMGRNPKAWAQGVVKGLQYGLNPKQVLRDMTTPGNQALHAEMAKYGIPIAKFETMEVLPQIEKALGNVPVAGKVLKATSEQTLGRANALFTGSVQTMKDRLWQSMKRPGMTESELQQLGKTIGEMTGYIPYESMGFSANQKAIEKSFVFFAPKYTRASLNFVANMFRSGMTGNEARRSIGQLMAGGAALYYGTAKAMGQEPNFDPSSARFMTVKVGDDYIGLGGTLYSLARLAGNVATVDSPKDLLTMNRFDNPFVKFMYGKSAPLTGMIANAVEGTDYLGQPFESTSDWARALADKVVPFSFQAFYDAEKPSPASFAAQFGGARTFPISTYEKRDEVRNLEAAKEGKNYKELTKAEQNVINRNPEIQKLSTQIKDEGRETPESLAWDSYNSEGARIEDTTRKEINLASKEYKATGNGTVFRDRVDAANNARRVMYATRAMNPEYELINKYFNTPKTPQELAKINPADRLMNEYQSALYNPETMLDQYGNYDFAKADAMEKAFVQKNGQAALDYVEKYSSSKWDEPTEYQELKAARKSLESYWQIESQVFSDRPDLQTIYNEWQTLLQQDSRTARKYLLTHPEAAAIVQRGKMVELTKKRMKLSNPQVALLLKKYY